MNTTDGHPINARNKASYLEAKAAFSGPAPACPQSANGGREWVLTKSDLLETAYLSA